MDIKYEVKIDYTSGVQFYIVNAPNKDVAVDVARELFILDYGLGYQVNYFARPLPITAEDMQYLHSVNVTLFSELSRMFEGKDYAGFVRLYVNLDGFSADISMYKDSSFWFRFRNIIARGIFQYNNYRNISYVDSSELYVKTKQGRTILVKDWREFYYVEDLQYGV